MRNVLVVAYEFPPTGGGGVQRVAKFCRYLPDSGWRPAVVCAEPARGRPVDPSLAAEVATVRVVRTPARHLAAGISSIAERLRLTHGRDPAAADAGPTPSGRATATTAARAGTQSRAHRIAAWVAVPDFAAYWVGPAVEAGVRLGTEIEAEAVIASGPPFSSLVAGARVAARLGVPFVADFRDAWRDNPGASHPTAWHRQRSLALERATVSAAAAVTCVSEPICAEVTELGGRRVTLLPNGFDPADLMPWTPDPAGPPRIAFMGWVYPAHSDPRPLFQAMALAAERSEAASDLTLDMIGPAQTFAIEAVERLGLGGRVAFHGYRPHAEALAMLSRADAGVVLIRDVPQSAGSYTGKIFEYLGMGLPILLAGPPDGVAAALVREANAGWVAPHGDPEAIAGILVRLAEDKRHAVAPPQRDLDVVARFRRPSQAAALAALLEDVTAAGSR